MMDPADFSDSLLAGQRLLAGFEGDCFNEDLRYLIDTLQVAGIILFSGNLGGPEDVRDMCAAAQAYASDCGLPPLIVAIDQEGGAVARLKEPFTQFPGNPHIHDREDADRFAALTCVELSHIGVNMNLAPVLDVAGFCRRSVMAERSFPGDPENVARLGSAVIEGFQRRGIMAVAKHFPGIGRTVVDSHVDRPELDANPDILAKTDLVPFRAAITSGVAGIMLSHVRYAYLDEAFPASLSVPIAGDMLRKQLGYGGVVMTDDLDMGAVTGYYDIPTVVRCLSRAGIDLALVCHKGPARDQVKEEFLRSVCDSAEDRAAALAAAGRIMALKKRYLMGARV